MAVDVDTLQRVMADGWRALERHPLGQWLLRASGGFTARGNSVLALGDPGCSLRTAVATAQDWYAARGLPAVFTRVDGAPGADALATLLRRHGYTPRSPTLALVADPASLPRPAGCRTPVTVQPTLTPAWEDAYAAYRPVLPEVAGALLTGSDAQVFLATHEVDRVNGITRVSFDRGWAGVHAMWVPPASRRGGLATALLAAAGSVAREAGVEGVYLLVEADNAPARALYGRHGFAVHHGYHYLVPP